MSSEKTCSRKVIRTIGRLKFCKCGEPNCILGIGTYGIVFRGRFEDAIDVAVKRVDKFLTKIQVDVLRKADSHQNILRYYDKETDGEIL